MISRKCLQRLLGWGTVIENRLRKVRGRQFPQKSSLKKMLARKPNQTMYQQEWSNMGH